MSPKIKNITKLALRIIITAALLFWVFSRIDLQQFRQTVKTARWEFLIAVWGLTLIVFWLNSIKMRFILKKQECDVSTGKIFGASAVTALYSMILPGLLSTGAKWYILKKDAGKGTNVLSSMVYNQFSTMVVMMVFGLAALIITNPATLLLPDTKNQWLLPAVCGILLVAIILISLLLLSSRTGGKVIKALGFLLRPLPATLRLTGQKILEQLSTFQTAGWLFHLKMFLFSLAGTIIYGIIVYVFAAKASGISVPVWVLVWQCALVFILGQLPISLANLGIREVALIESLALYGVNAPSALLMSLIIFSSKILLAIIGAVYQLSWTIRGGQKVTDK